MPKNAMGAMLEQLGKAVPEVDEVKAQDAVGGTGFICAQTGRNGTQMARPPFKGPIGAWIYDNIAKETFDAWIAQGTKVINELRLDLSRDEDAKVYDENMLEYLGIDEDLQRELAKTSDS